MQLAWAAQIPGRVLILAPLCVAEQTVAEGVKFGVEVKYAQSQPASEGARIVIANYERLDAFHPEHFAGVVLDESSILKAFDGKTRQRLIDTFQSTPYRLCCTATPSPNDIAELANHAEFLGLMTRQEFLATWFVHDDAGWRMKGHAVQPFYRWLASWAIAMRKPSDIGYDDTGFELPPLTIEDHVVEGGDSGGVLFPELGLKGIQGRQKARRASVEDRVQAVIGLMLKSFHDEGRKSGILPGVESKEQGVGQGISRRSSEQGSAEGMGEQEIPNRQSVQGENASSSQGLRASQSTDEETLEYEALRTDTGSVRGDALSTEEQMRDLWTEPEEQEALSACRPLPQDKEGQRAFMRQLQSRYREIQRRLSPARESGSLPKWIAWCGLNVEQDMLAALLGDEWCVSVSGADSMREKIRKTLQWVNDPTMPIMLSKMRVLGFGMNFQHCHKMAMVGLGDSWEQYYQALRRCHRFGQQHPVDAHIVVSNSERAIVSNVRRKQADADEMARQLLVHMRDFEREELSA